jgi:hypothetical protein
MFCESVVQSKETRLDPKWEYYQEKKEEQDGALGMKKCRFCAEEIQEEAVKCKHCGASLVEAWYFKTAFVVSSFLVVGPLALPLVWWNPRYAIKTKIIVTLVTLCLTFIFIRISFVAVKGILDYYSLIFNSL